VAAVAAEDQRRDDRDRDDQGGNRRDPPKG
jgi:hypothetical protein